MDAADGDTHSSHIHNEATVTVDTDDVALESCQLSTGDAEQDAVAGIIMEWFEQETDTLRLSLVDAHKGTHLGV